MRRRSRFHAGSVYCRFHVLVILERDSGKRDQMLEAIQNLSGGLFRDRVQHPLQLEHNCLRNESPSDSSRFAAMRHFAGSSPR
jgi:hypothetical protein